MPLFALKRHCLGTSLTTEIDAGLNAGQWLLLKHYVGEYESLLLSIVLASALWKGHMLPGAGTFWFVIFWQGNCNK